MNFALITFLVPDYEAGIDFFTGTLGFTLVEDTRLSDTKRWVVARPPSGGSDILIAKATTPQQTEAIGGQAGGRVGFFLHTDDFDAMHARLAARGIGFLEEARREPYGLVAKFRDPFGNLWDLIEPVA